MVMRLRIVAMVLVTVCAGPGMLWASEDDLDTERTLSEILQDKRIQEAKASGDVSGRDTTV